jgi:hypothetical protein
MRTLAFKAGQFAREARDTRQGLRNSPDAALRRFRVQFSVSAAALAWGKPQERAEDSR